MSGIRKKQSVLNDFLFSVWYQHDLDSVDDFVTKDTIVESSYGNATGKNNIKSIVLDWWLGFPKTEQYIHEMHENDTTFVRKWQAECYHDGVFLGYEPTHKKIHYSGTSMYKVEDDRISYYNVTVDLYTIIQQICGGSDTSTVHSEELINKQLYCLTRELSEFPDVAIKALSQKETFVLAFWMNGRSAKEIANFFSSSNRTVETQIYSIMNKLTCSNKTDLFNLVYDSGKLMCAQRLYNLLLHIYGK